MSWDVVARALFVDNGAAAGLARFNDQIHGIAKAAPGGMRGLNAIEGGMRSLAFEAAGVSGPMGRIAEGLLKFGGGSALVLGAAAGIGLIAQAYKMSAAAAEEMRTSNEKLAESWRNTAARGRPLVALANELQKAIDAETDAQDKLNRLTALVPGGGAGGAPKTFGDEGEIALAQTGLSQAQANVFQMRTLFRDAQVQLASDAQKAGVKTAQAFVDNIKHMGPALQLELLRLGERQFGPRFERLGGESGEIFGAAWLKAAQGMLDRGLDPQGNRLGVGAPRGLTRFPLSGGKLEPGTTPAFKPEKFAPREFFLSDMEKAITKPRPEKPDPARLAAEAVALLGALKQGGAAGILGAGGAIASDLSGLKGLKGLGPIGIGLNVASGIFGLFDHSEERRHKEMLAAMKDLRPERNPTRVTINLVSPTTGEVVKQAHYEIGRREDRDASDRDGRSI